MSFPEEKRRDQDRKETRQYRIINLLMQVLKVGLILYIIFRG